MRDGQRFVLACEARTCNCWLSASFNGLPMTRPLASANAARSLMWTRLMQCTAPGSLHARRQTGFMHRTQGGQVPLGADLGPETFLQGEAAPFSGIVLYSPKVAVRASFAVLSSVRSGACITCLPVTPHAVIAVLQFLVRDQHRRVPNMSARSHYREDGTHRRTKGEKQARKGYGGRREERSAVEASTARTAWRPKHYGDQEYDHNAGWGTTVGQRYDTGSHTVKARHNDRWGRNQEGDQIAQAEAAVKPTEPAPAPSYHRGMQTETTVAKQLPLQPRNTLLIKLPDGKGILKLMENLEQIRKESELLQVLFSSKPKDGRWTILLEGTQQDQDKAKAMLREIMESAQGTAGRLQIPETGDADSSALLAASAPGSKMHGDSGQKPVEPPALPLTFLPDIQVSVETALDHCPEEDQPQMGTSEPTVKAGSEMDADLAQTVQSASMTGSDPDSDAYMSRGTARAALPIPSACLICSTYQLNLPRS